MIQDKIIELYGYGLDIEKIILIIIKYYNDNPFNLDKFEPLDEAKGRKLVVDTILLHNMVVGY